MQPNSRDVNKDTNRALFLDRDGVINVQLVGDYVKCIEEFTFREDFLKSIPFIAQKFQHIIVVTNQQGIAKGICTQENVDFVHEYLCKTLDDKGLHIDKVYVCPHLAGGGCHCRKPETGMALQAQHDFPFLDLRASVMVGDSASDMVFGRRCGMETVFIGKITPENEQEVQKNSDHIVSSLYDYIKNC